MDIKTVERMRGVHFSLPQGGMHIGIMSDNTLEGFHECDLDTRSGEAVEMKFFKPSGFLSVLVCPNCAFRVEFQGLPRDGFRERFNEIEEWLRSRMRLFWSEQPHFSDSAVLGPVKLRINPGVIFGQRIEAWHCRDLQNLSFSRNIWVKMSEMQEDKKLVLHCSSCGYTVGFKYHFNMTPEEIVKSLRQALNS